MPTVKVNGRSVPWSVIIHILMATFYAGGLWFKVDALEKLMEVRVAGIERRITLIEEARADVTKRTP